MVCASVHEGQSPLILSFPHSGTTLPQDVAGKLNAHGRSLPDTDWHVPKLYGFARDLDVTWVEAAFSRYVIDLNRDPTGVSLYPGRTTTALCPQQSFDGQPIWQEGKAPDEKETARRLERYFLPYHQALAAQIGRVKARHGFAVLYDCHSIKSHIPALFEGALPVLNLGTNDGCACTPKLENRIADILATAPQSMVVNGRFKGGWITRHYGKPRTNVHALQMEIAQSAYMDEGPPFTWQANRAKGVQETLKPVLAALADFQG